MTLPNLPVAALLEHSHDAIALIAADGTLAFVSDAITRLTGRSPAALTGAMRFEHIHPDDQPIVERAIADCRANPGQRAKVEFRMRTLDNRWVWLEALGTNHLNNSAVAGVVVNIRDITERRESVDRFQEVRGLLEATGRLARIGGWEYMIPDDRLIWTEQTYRIHDVTPGQYKPSVADAINFYAPESRPLIRAAVDRGIAAGQPWNLILAFITDTGRRLWVNSIGHVEHRDGQPYRLYGTFQDVTERVESERAVQQSAARYQNLFETAPVAIWEEDLTAIAEWFSSLRQSGVTDLAAHLAANPGLTAVATRMIRVRDVNRAAVLMNRARDKDDLINNMHRLFTSESLVAYANELVSLWNGERTLRIELRAARLDGSPTDLVLHLHVPEVGGQPDFTRVAVIVLDVTHQKRLEEQFRQSQKLEAIGRLAGGIAHDFNNLLTVINGFAELILADSSPESGVRDLVTHIRDAGVRAADLTRQLLAFSRKQSLAAGPLDVSAVVAGLRPLLAPLVGDEVRLVTRLASVPMVLADKGQLEQVVMNLAVNARDAMPAGGTLTLETSLVESALDDGSDLPHGRWIVLSVADTGTGIPEEVRPYLFEPFFTTKELGKGTGLGLPTVYGIVTTAGGHLRYDTAVHAGTTFRVYLPALSPEVGPLPSAGEETIRKRPKSDSRADSWRLNSFREHSVLLVEDLPEVRNLSALILADAGFAVTTAEDGPDALDKLAAMSEPPDLLVTDMRMPGMNGRELAMRVRDLLPAVRVLFVSGYPAEFNSASDLDRPDDVFLTKPFSPDELIAAVQGLLERRPPLRTAGR